MITPSNFMGKWAIAIPYGDNKLQTYIDVYVSLYMAKLFGAAMYQEWDDDNDLFPELIEPFVYQPENGCSDKILISQGVVSMLKSFVFAHYKAEDLGTSTSTGTVKLQPEGGQLVNDDYTARFHLYNEAVKSFRAIQGKIKDNIEDYPTYKGIDVQTTWLI